MWGRIFTSLLVMPGPLASASPWAQEDGALYTRLAVSSETVDGADAWRFDGYGEYGLSDVWTLTAKVETIRFEGASDFNNDSARLTVRRQMFRSGGWVGALEGGLIQGGAIGNQNTCETIGLEARGGVGWSGKWRKTQTFTFAELAGRFHDGCERQRVEFGLGQQATENIWSITQFWSERGSEKASSDKVRSELLWRSGAMDYSIGYRQEVGGRFEEEAVFLAAVRRF